MKPTERGATAAPCQLSLALDTVRLRGLNASERSAVIALLAELLLEAGDVVARESSDDGV